MAKALEQMQVNVVREQPAPCRLKLDIEVPVEAVLATVAKVEAEYRKQGRIPGFRAGKAPQALLRRHYGERILADAKERLVNQGTHAALEQESIEPITMPQVANEAGLAVDESRSFVFAVEFDVAPTFELPDYRHLELPDDTVAVGDQEVEAFIGEMLTHRTSFAKVERPAAAGDLLKASYQAQLEADFELPTTAKYLAEGKETWVALREPEILPGIAAALTGAEAGSQHDLSIAFPADFYESSLAGKTLPYHLEVHEVHAPNQPELTDEFAKQFGAENAAEMREIVRRNLQQRQSQEKGTARHAAVVEQLLAKVDLALPPAVLAHESYEVLVRLFQQQAQRQTDEQQVRDQVDKLRGRAGEIASHNLKRKFLLDKIAEVENISVSEREVAAMVAALARQQGINEKKMVQQLRDANRIGDLIDDIRGNKTVARIIELNTPKAESAE